MWNKKPLGNLRGPSMQAAVVAAVTVRHVCTAAGDLKSSGNFELKRKSQGFKLRGEAKEQLVKKASSDSLLRRLPNFIKALSVQPAESGNARACIHKEKSSQQQSPNKFCSAIAQRPLTRPPSHHDVAADRGSIILLSFSQLCWQPGAFLNHGIGDGDQARRAFPRRQCVEARRQPEDAGG